MTGPRTDTPDQADADVSLGGSNPNKARAAAQTDAEKKEQDKRAAEADAYNKQKVVDAYMAARKGAFPTLLRIDKLRNNEEEVSGLQTAGGPPKVLEAGLYSFKNWEVNGKKVNQRFDLLVDGNGGVSTTQKNFSTPGQFRLAFSQMLHVQMQQGITPVKLGWNPPVNKHYLREALAELKEKGVPFEFTDTLKGELNNDNNFSRAEREKIYNKQIQSEANQQMKQLEHTTATNFDSLNTEIGKNPPFDEAQEKAELNGKSDEEKLSVISDKLAEMDKSLALMERAGNEVSSHVEFCNTIALEKREAFKNPKIASQTSTNPGSGLEVGPITFGTGPFQKNKWEKFGKWVQSWFTDPDKKDKQILKKVSDLSNNEAVEKLGGTLSSKLDDLKKRRDLLETEFNDLKSRLTSHLETEKVALARSTKSFEEMKKTGENPKVVESNLQQLAQATSKIDKQLNDISKVEKKLSDVKARQGQVSEVNKDAQDYNKTLQKNIEIESKNYQIQPPQQPSSRRP